MNRLESIQNIIHESITCKQKLLSDVALLQKIQQCAELCVNSLKAGNRIILAGNGGSAADAQHIAAEFVSRFEFDRPGLPALSLATDTSMITAIGNDYGYENLFKRQLEANAVENDVFIGISTSGASANILSALRAARENKIHAIGLTGDSGKMEGYCDLIIDVPSSSTARIQEMHIMIGHCICAIVENELFA